MTVKKTIDDSSSDQIERMNCSLVSHANQEDPIGSAATHERYLLVEVPLPWAYKVEDSKNFPSGLAAVMKQMSEEGKPCRLLSFISDFHRSEAGYRRVMYYQRPDAPFSSFDKQEYIVPDDQLSALAEAILIGGTQLSAFEEYLEPTEGIRDLFVCTHGSHDRCCGKFGFPIYKEIEERFASAPVNKLRVWRTSHFGGHRHAPTIMDFPEGRYWAQMTPELLDILILRKGAVSDISGNYRGWGGIGAFEQVAERAMFAREGWEWINYKKKSTVLKKDENSAYVRIEYGSSDGMISGRYEAWVSTISTVVRAGGCGNGLSEVRQFKVSELMNYPLYFETL